jgi:hypothetical protein
MEGQIQSATLAAASVVIQLCLLLIALVTLLVLMRSRAMAGNSIPSIVLLAIWFLFALFAIVLGEEFFSTWQAVLGGFSLPTIPKGRSFQVVFALNIVFTSALIVLTGGTKRSPFTSILLLLPSLAIFLREPTHRFLTYSAVVAALYVMLLTTGRSQWLLPQYAQGDFRSTALEEEAVDNAATIWANIMCLMLATLIGYITLP